MMDHLVNSRDGAHYDSAGTVEGGRAVWGSIDLNESISVGDDKTQGYLFFSTSHDGSGSHSYKLMGQRIICANQTRMAMSRKANSYFSVRHTQSANDRLADAHAILEALSAEFHSLEEKLHFLRTRKLTRDSAETIFDRLFPAADKDAPSTRRQNTLSAILERFEHNDGDAFPEQRGSALNLYNAITEHTDHFRGTNVEKRRISACFGQGAQLKEKALETITLEADSMPSMSNIVDVTVAQQAGGGNLLDTIIERQDGPTPELLQKLGLG